MNPLQGKDMAGMLVTQRARTPNSNMRSPEEGDEPEGGGGGGGMTRPSQVVGAPPPPPPPPLRLYTSEGKAQTITRDAAPPQSHRTESTEKCSPTIVSFLSELRNAFNCIVKFLSGGRKSKGNKARGRQEDEEGWDAAVEDEEEEEDETDGSEMRIASSLTFIFSQCVGWIVCCFFAGKKDIYLFIFFLSQISSLYLNKTRKYEEKKLN